MKVLQGISLRCRGNMWGLAKQTRTSPGWTAVRMQSDWQQKERVESCLPTLSFVTHQKLLSDYSPLQKLRS